MASTTAWAAEPGPDTLPINVIAVQTPDADDQAEALTKALRGAVRAVPGWSLGEGDYSLEVLTLSLKCPEPPDADCQSRIADSIKSDRYVWGIIQKKGDNVTGKLYLWVRGQGTTEVPIDYSANLTEPNDDALKQVALAAVNRLTGGPPKGSLHVKAGQVQGQVFVDGQPMGALAGGEGTFMVPSGQHRITVKAPGYADAETTATVKGAGAPTDVSLTLVPIEVKTPMNWKRIGGFGAIGLGVGFGVVGLVSALKVNSLQNDQEFIDHLKTVPQGQDGCANPPGDIKTKYCDASKGPEVMQAVFFPLAAISAGIGTYLVLTSGKSQPTTGLRVNPQVGTQGGKLDVSLTW